MFKKTLVLIFVLLALSVGVSAQDMAETGWVRFAHFGVDAGPVIVYTDGVAFSATGDEPTAFEYRVVTDYLELPAGTYSLAVAPEGSALEDAILGPVDLEIEAGHSYTTMVYGQIADESLTWKHMDETAELVNYELEEAVAPVILFQGISEVPAVDIYAGDALFLENIPFGDIRIIDFPLSVVPITITVHGDKDTVVLQENFFGVPNTLALAALMGSFPDNYTRVITNTTDMTAIEFLAAAGDSPVVSFNTLVTAITTLATSGVAMPETDDNSTFFAPVDAAFAALPEGALDELLANPEMLLDVLLYHGVQGPLYSGQIVGGIMEAGSLAVPSALGPDLTFTLTENGLFINDTVQVIYADIRTADGIVHAISGVLMPPAQ